MLSEQMEGRSSDEFEARQGKFDSTSVAVPASSVLSFFSLLDCLQHPFREVIDLVRNQADHS